MRIIDNGGGTIPKSCLMIKYHSFIKTQRKFCMKLTAKSPDSGNLGSCNRSLCIDGHRWSKKKPHGFLVKFSFNFSCTGCF